MDPDEVLRLFRGQVAEYHRSLASGNTSVGQLEDIAAEAMIQANDLFEWLAKGGHAPDWSAR
jgi:hypothetical protein